MTRTTILVVVLGAAACASPPPEDSASRRVAVVPEGVDPRGFVFSRDGRVGAFIGRTTRGPNDVTDAVYLNGVPGEPFEVV